MAEIDRLTLLSDGYRHPRELPDGRVLALFPMAFTVGLCVMRPGYHDHTRDAAGNVRIDDGRLTRYCYADPWQAVLALVEWDGAGDPPGPWVKQKPEGRLNPRLANPDAEF